MWTVDAQGNATTSDAAEISAFVFQLNGQQHTQDDPNKKKQEKPRAKEKDDPVSHKVSRWTNYLAAGTIAVGLGPEDPIADAAAGAEELIGQGTAGLAWLVETGIDLYSIAKGHGNSDNNSDPHIVYEIISSDMNGGVRTEKYGISGREDNQDGNNGRPAYQVNKLNKSDPTRVYSWVKLAKTDSRVSAKTIETFLVSKYVAQYHRMPPRQILPLPK